MHTQSCFVMMLKSTSGSDVGEKLEVMRHHHPMNKTFFNRALYMENSKSLMQISEKEFSMHYMNTNDTKAIQSIMSRCLC